MGNVIKYRTNVVLCFVVALAFAVKISRKHVRIVFTSISLMSRIDIALRMYLTVASFTLAVSNHGYGWLKFKIILTICQFL